MKIKTLLLKELLLKNAEAFASYKNDLGYIYIGYLNSIRHHTKKGK